MNEATAAPYVPALKLPKSRAATLEAANKLLASYQRELHEIKAERQNAGMQGMLDGLFGSEYPLGHQNTDAMPFTLGNANAYVPISLNRILLSYSYMTQGLLRTVVDQPVEDAFRGGIRFKSSELDEDDLKKLNLRFKRKHTKRTKKTQLTAVNTNAGYNQANSDLDACKLTIKWARLYGGAGMIINTDQDFRKELDVEKIGEDSPLTFIAADRWELILSQLNINDERIPNPYNYYGLQLNRSRVEKVLWAEAPSYIRLRLQGWGMSIFEECIRPVNTFIKFETLLFELLDEAKIDVYKIEGFNTSLASDSGQSKIQRRVALGNQLKNFSSAITMDMKDDYEQKQLSFSGLAEIWDQLRTNLCAYLKFPKNKLFGESAGGFGSGKDSLENYNATVSNIRESAEPTVMVAGELRCQQLFGFIPEDLECEWTPLELMDGEQQEKVKTSKQMRALEQFDRGLTTGKEASEILKKNGLLDIDTEVLDGLRDVEPPPTQNPGELEAEQTAAKELAAAKPKPPAAGAK